MRRERPEVRDRKSAGSVRSVARAFFVASFVASFVAASSAVTFDQQRNVMKATIVNQPESAIQSLLKAGINEGKSVLAIAEAQKWLRQNQAQDAMTLYYAARASELSGDLKGAVSLYQQYLKKADLKSATADEAVYAVYALLLDRLKDTAGAYAFSKNEGDRLLVCPRAKQFDKWFLDEAVRHPRYDALAVANRLKACIDAGYPEDLLIARYDNYFRWILSRVSGGYGFNRDAQVSREILDACKGLASSMNLLEEVKLRLDWNVSARFYVQQKLAKKEVDAPIAEAEALLAKYPEYAAEVLLGWAGGTRDNHPNNTGDPALFWEDELDAKMAPIVAAAAKLTPGQLSGLVAMWQREGYWREPQRLKIYEVKAVKDFLKANPQARSSSKYASPLTKGWDRYTPEEAMALAPKIAQNRHNSVSLVRAIAAGGKERDFDKVMAAFRGPERWRLSANDMRSWMTDRLWHYCNGPGGSKKRDEEIAKSKALAKQMEAKLVKADAPANQRIAEFRKLWADYRSPQPKIPDVRNRLKQVLQFTPEVIPELLKDSSGEAQKLARDAMARGMTGPDPMWKELDWRKDLKTTHYDPIMQAYVYRHRGMAEIKKRYPNKCKPHPLEGALRNSIIGGLKQNKLVPWQVQAWINAQWPENNEKQVKLMQAMFKSPAWKTMPFEVQFSAREWFKKDAMTAGQVAWIDRGNAKLACKDLIALKKDADLQTTATALGKAIEGVKKSPIRIGMQGLDQLAAVTNTVFTDPKVFDQILEVVDNMHVIDGTDALGGRLLALAKKNPDPVVIQRIAVCIWNRKKTDPRTIFNLTVPFVQSLLEDSPAAALTMSRLGISIYTGYRSYGFDWQKQIAPLKAVAGKAAMELGLVKIPVAKNSPAYPIYKSQAEWLTGNEDSAWIMLVENWDQLLPIHRQMSVDYLMWALQRTIYTRDDARMEALVKALLAWSRESGSPWTKSQKLDLDIAYGDIALQLGQIENAHKIFVKTQQNPAYADMIERHKATLCRVKVERIAKRFDDALQTLSDLDMEKIPELWAPSRYARAEVYYDMGQYDDAADDIEAILARYPDHAEAKIMQGKVQLKRQKLMEASELDVGSKNAKNTLVPGDNLKVTLVDPTLAVSGAGTEVEVSVTTTSGDKETFFLRQFGDQKTKFRGEVRTALGAPKQDDGVLQVIGDDEIYYDYSERFRKKMNNMAANPGGPITVKSDAILMASAHKLLSEAEQRVADMEEKMANIARGHQRITAGMVVQAEASVAREAAKENRTREDREAAEAAEKERLAKKLLAARVKPGASINVRVIDPDASRTAGIDEVAVSVASSSGDSIGRVVLKETGTHTGWFEGKVPTAGAQAMAFAPNSEPGRNPNTVISPRTDYPAWRPEAVKNKTPSFRIDLNDNVPLGEMTITAKENGAKLKKFILQTGMNDKDMTVVATYPKNDITLDKPWDPSVTIMNDTDYHQMRNERSVYDLRELRQQVERDWMTQQFPQHVADNVAGPSEAFTNSIPSRVKWKRQSRWDYSHIVYRFRGYFYEPAMVTRRFKLELGKFQIPKNMHPSVNAPPQFLLAVDGIPITSKETPDKLEGERSLKPGVHTFEIWATGWSGCIGFGRSSKLLANLDDQDHMVECPDSFFDPSKAPPGMLPHRNGKATITANDGGTQFNVKFAPGSRTRLINLVLIGQEGPVPALNRITLQDDAGRTVLPVKFDYAELNKNNTLEILTGDKIAVRYVDDRFVTKAKEKHERILNVSFSDADCGFVYFKMIKKWNGHAYVNEPYYEHLLRFKHGEPLTLKISDADMDMTDKPDKITVTLESRSGGRKKFTAKETEPSSGEFRLVVIPVPGKPTKPNEIQVAKGEKVYAVYRDEENVRPGVPTDRLSSVMHAVYKRPQVRMSHATVTPIDYSKLDPNAQDPRRRPPGMRGLNVGFATVVQKRAEAQAAAAEGAQGLMRGLDREEQNMGGGRIRPAWWLSNRWVNVERPPNGGITAVQGQIVRFEIEAQHLALRSGSRVAMYAQTDAGREQGSLLGGSLDREATEPAFDITVPGTVKLVAGLAGVGTINRLNSPPQIPIYNRANYLRATDGSGVFNRSTKLFSCAIPLIADFLPKEGVISDAEIERRRERKIPYSRPTGLVVRPGEKIHVGFQYEDESGATKWITGTAKVKTHPALDVMGEDLREEKETAYVGETLYVRVVDLGADISDTSDKVKVTMKAKSGASHKFELLEIDNHSGVFVGNFELSYVQKGKSDDPEYSVKRDGFPVVYADVMGVAYTDKLGQKAKPRLVTIQKGADGTIVPFSKKYDDPKIAVRTQFSLAEAYLEMAKRHRKLGEEELALGEYQRAKDMLDKAMEIFREPDTRAQAEYLLGNLTQEEADATEDKQVREERYRAALSRYMRVTGSYPDTLAASKAQFKVATVYESLGEPEIAAQEYVKLAYKYPDSEFLAIAMAKLGTHFQRKAGSYEKKAKELLAQVDDKDAQFEGRAMEKMYIKEYLKSAEIFLRLQQRFPSHELAGKAGLLAGQAFMRARENRDAVNAFKRVFEHEEYDGPAVRAQAMYWAGLCYEVLKEDMAAYSIYKRLTYDFPESRWASFARGQLSSDKLVMLETDLEEKRLEEEGKR